MIPSSRRKSNLYPWRIVRLLPNMQRIVIARFHHYSNADGYLAVLKRLMPNATHIIIFEVEPDEVALDADRSR